MKHLKKFNESKNFNIESIKDLFQDLEIDYNITIDIQSFMINGVEDFKITIQFCDNKSPNNFGEIIKNYIDRSEELFPNLSLDKLDLFFRYKRDGKIYHICHSLLTTDGIQKLINKYSEIISLDINLRYNNTYE